MLKPLRCEFLTGALTDVNSMDVLRDGFEQQRSSIHEILYYKKNGTGIWLEVGGTYVNLFNSIIQVCCHFCIIFHGWTVLFTYTKIDSHKTEY